MNHDLPGDGLATSRQQNHTAVKRVYIAGPMTLGGTDESGLEDRLRKFHQVEEYLRARGYEVENPANTPDTDPPRTWREWMVSGINQLMTCDAIYMLPGWSASKGARLEYEIARSFGMELMGEVKR